MAFQPTAGMKATDQTSYHLELRPVPGPWLAPPEQRLRRLLKVALRGFGFRCLACRPVTAQAAVTVPQEAAQKHSLFVPIVMPLSGGADCCQSAGTFGTGGGRVVSAHLHLLPPPHPYPSFSQTAGGGSSRTSPSLTPVNSVIKLNL